MKKLFPAILLLSVMLFFFSQVIPQDSAGFKNLKVLKPASKGELLRTMAAYNKELGVKCEYCHSAKDYADESKPQFKMARLMQTMVNDINTNYFRYKDAPKVACVFCHGGNPKPRALMEKK